MLGRVIVQALGIDRFPKRAPSVHEDRRAKDCSKNGPKCGDNECLLPNSLHCFQWTPVPRKPLHPIQRDLDPQHGVSEGIDPLSVRKSRCDLSSGSTGVKKYLLADLLIDGFTFTNDSFGKILYIALPDVCLCMLHFIPQSLKRDASELILNTILISRWIARMARDHPSQINLSGRQGFLRRVVPNYCFAKPHQHEH